MNVVELRILISTSDDSPNAPDRIESLVRRALGREFSPELLYVELAPHGGK